MRFSFFLAVVCTLLSQLPVLLGTTVGSALKLSWVLPFVVTVLWHNKDLYCKPLGFVYALLAVFGVYCYLLQIVLGETYIGSDLYNMLLSLFICVISYSYWKHSRREKDLIWLSFIILIVSAYVGYVVYDSVDLLGALESLQYAARTKNSLSTILLAAAIFGFVFFRSQKKFLQYCGYFLEVVLVFFIFLLKSRATILGFVFVLLYYLTKYQNKKVKRALWVIGIGGAVYLALNPNVWQSILNGIIYAGRDAGNFNELSSGRFDTMFYLAQRYYKSFVFGIGCYYFDCMPFVMVLQYGIFGACFVFVLLGKLGKLIHSLDRSNPIFLCTFLLFWVFIINSLFEAQPPFGPGAKCFLFWVSLGFSMAELESERSAITLFK